MVWSCSFGRLELWYTCNWLHQSSRLLASRQLRSCLPSILHGVSLLRFSPLFAKCLYTPPSPSFAIHQVLDKAGIPRWLGDPDVGRVEDLTLCWMGACWTDIAGIAYVPKTFWSYLTLRLKCPRPFVLLPSGENIIPKKLSKGWQWNLGMRCNWRVSGNRFPSDSPYSLHVPSTCGLIHIESFLKVWGMVHAAPQSLKLLCSCGTFALMLGGFSLLFH